jgi:polysaccharide export outer membrane protein
MTVLDLSKVARFRHGKDECHRPGEPVTRSVASRWLCLCALALVSLAPASAFAVPLSQQVVIPGDSVEMDWSRVPGDLLTLNFGPQENGVGDLYKPLRVRPDGRISVFPVGDVIAAGHTSRELEAVLVDLLAAEFRNPRVTVEVSEVAGNEVHVLGQVKTPGSYKVTPFMTTLQAITTAGGFADDAARNSVIVFHRNGARTVLVTRLRLGDGIKFHELGLDQPLSRFDIVYVPRSAIGNLNQFTHQFFAEQAQTLSTFLLGWELFNLDRVFFVPTIH